MDETEEKRTRLATGTPCSASCIVCKPVTLHPSTALKLAGVWFAMVASRSTPAACMTPSTFWARMDAALEAAMASADPESAKTVVYTHPSAASSECL